MSLPVVVSLDTIEIKQLGRFAKMKKTTRAIILKAAVKEYLSRLEFEMLCKKGSALARAKGIFTDDDVFRIVS